MSVGSDRRTSFVREGVSIHRESGRQTLPMLSGSVHYWQLEPASWRPALSSVKAMGFRLVDTYVPWSVHEQSDGTFDFGQSRASLDVALFLRIAHELGLHAIVRPGPHIHAELSSFGIPERVLWDAACQAKGPSGAPVVLPFVPRMFPVPSYASQAFRSEVSRYFDALTEVLAPLCAPTGPIVAVQVDNNAAFYFRDGVYDQDHHADAISAYGVFLRERYASVEALQAAYPHVVPDGVGALDADHVPPPTALLVPKQPAVRREELAHHLDWAAFQEALVGDALEAFADMLRTGLSQRGVSGMATTHNLPLAQDATPLDVTRIGDAVDLVGLDYYHRARRRSSGASAGLTDRTCIARRTSELALRAEALAQPAFATEMGAGFPPYHPPLSERDGAFTLLCALAYGLRGYNLYMAVERDRWIGAPVDRDGRPRDAATFYTRLNQALAWLEWPALRRRVPVRIVVPRAERRLARVLHAFGPASAALFGVSGMGPREACIESDLDLGAVPAIDVDTMLRAFEQALEARGVPYAVTGGEQPGALDGAQWAIVLTSGGIGDGLVNRLREAAEGGMALSMGPVGRGFDAVYRPAEGIPCELVERSDPAAIDAVVAAHVADLDGPLLACDPDGVVATVHQTAAGASRAVFVLNTSGDELLARVTLGEDGEWLDLLENTRAEATGGVLEVRMRPHSVSLFGRREDGEAPPVWQT